MTEEEISRFVDGLEAGNAEVADFHRLSRHDWDEVKRVLEARRQYNMQKYVNALFACRMKAEAGRPEAGRVFTEAEILAEFS